MEQEILEAFECTGCGECCRWSGSVLLTNRDITEMSAYLGLSEQEFIDRHVFYDGRHLSVELLTAMLEEYARPRPMTLEERRALLSETFAASQWDVE